TAGLRAPLGAAGVESAVLKSLASRLEARIGVLTIEASAPVPYVTSQPDPRSFVVELRDVVTAGVVPAVTPDPRGPIAGVRVDTATGVDGAAVARVNVTLSQPGRPRVRSSRNLIIVEADRADAEMSAPGAISAAGPAAVIRDLKFAHEGATTSVTLVGTGRLNPLSVRLAPEGRRRLILEFANVSSAVPQTATPGQGPVSQVRIGLSTRSPLITEVALELARPVNHAVQASADGQSLTVRLDDPQAVVAAAPPVPDVPGTPTRPVVVTSAAETSTATSDAGAL